MYSYRELTGLVSESLSAYKASITTGSCEISSLVAASQELLGAAPAAEPWLAYVADIAGVIVQGLIEMLLVSLKYLLSQAKPHLTRPSNLYIGIGI